MDIRAGTSGYSYKEWRGSFYPDDLSPDNWLSYYASQLDAVEINNTFYRMPKTQVVEAWRDTVPSDFRFVLKASRRITHQGRLQNVAQATSYLVERATVLGEQLGALLFQLPPNLSLDLKRLRSFQSLLPTDMPVAFEFRHPSWDTDKVSYALEEAGHARVISHSGKAKLPDLDAGHLLYLRLRAAHYPDEQLRKIAAQLVAAKPDRALVFFKHEEAGAGPRLAKQLRADIAQLNDKPRPMRAPRSTAARPSRRGPMQAQKKVVRTTGNRAGKKSTDGA